MSINNNLSMTVVNLKKKVYIYIYLFLLLFMVMNLYSYQSDYNGTKYFFNWVLYSLNQSITSVFVIPILFTLTISYMLSTNDNSLIIYRMKNRNQIFLHNVWVIIYNDLIFIAGTLGTIILLSISSQNKIQFNWDEKSIKSFSTLFSGLIPYNTQPIIQIIMLIVFMFLFLLFLGLLTQTINLLFKNKATPTFINIFLIILQGKVSSIPGFNTSFIKYFPNSHFLFYSDQTINFTDTSNFNIIVFYNIIYWIICIFIITFILEKIYKHKQFN